MAINGLSLIIIPRRVFNQRSEQILTTRRVLKPSLRCETEALMRNRLALIVRQK